MILNICIGLCGLGFGLLIGWLLSIRIRVRLKHSVHFLKALIQQSSVAFFYQDLHHPRSVFISAKLALTFNLKTPIKWADILSCFEFAEAQQLNQSYLDLVNNGKPFSFFLENKALGAHFLIDGTVLHTTHYHGLLISFHDVSELANKLHLSTLIEQHKNILAQAMDSLNFPLFIRDKNGLTVFANNAVNYEKTSTLNELSWLSFPFQLGDSYYTLTYGQATKTEEELNLILSNMVGAQRRLCEQLPCAVCLFNANGQLLACSPSFAKLWHLDNRWIQSEPSYEDYWDVIQDNGLLSRVSDFAEYKKQQRDQFACLSRAQEVYLYLPNGKIICRTLIPYVQGCVILLDEDHTDLKK